MGRDGEGTTYKARYGGKVILKLILKIWSEHVDCINVDQRGSNYDY
jgi:hypothetical protein